VNEFEQQFLIESREFAEQATQGLLILEQSPHDAERLDSVFRAFHTLKGGAAIVEFAAMERLMHGVENLLSEVRSGKRPLDPGLVGECLAALDLALQWLDTLESTGAFPADALTQAERPGTGTPGDWSRELVGRFPALDARAMIAIRYIPDSDCFYHAEDPVSRLSSIPGLLAVNLEPVNEWPRLAELDPFSCNLILTALSIASIEVARAHMSGHSGICEILPVESAGHAVTRDPLPAAVREILAAQLAMLGEATSDNFVGHVGSAGRAASNALRSCGRGHDAENLTIALRASLADSAVQPLHDALVRALSSAPPAAEPTPQIPPVQRSDIIPRTLRVDAERIDALVRLTGELTVAKNAVGHVAKVAQEDATSIAGMLKDRYAVLDHLVSELQRAVLAIRVLPLRTVLQRLPRVVREMSTVLGKPAKLEIEGEDTEADKSIVEMLFEPLLHIVRNALDHGIESPAMRASRGKPELATVRIRASRQSDQVLVEVSDDGGGVNVERVRTVARERGVATEEVLRSMAEADVVDLVFAPGFSTAAEVTELSGRGVGMDAVRTAVERVGGRVALESRSGLGTTVRFSLPFSLMMTQLMTIEAGGQMFGLPLDAVIETVRVPGNTLTAIGAAHAIVLRDRTIPVVDLGSMVGTQPRQQLDEHVTIVIAALAGQLTGIRVDRLGERMEAILKPLDGLLAGIPGISGTTLLGDGRVLLVLDVGEMLH
jgi:two-component system chemotaxis sensor kinase CheA